MPNAHTLRMHATGLTELRSRAEALTTWKLALSKGVLPAAEEVEWPQEPFKTKFIVSTKPHIRRSGSVDACCCVCKSCKVYCECSVDLVHR